MSRSKKIGIGLIAGYLVLLCVATVCSIKHYQDNLTHVALTVPEPGVVWLPEQEMEKEYDWTLKGSMVHLNQYEQCCVYVIEPEKGAWGEDFVIREEVIICHPQDPGNERVAVFSLPDKPIVGWSSDMVYDGMKVWLVEEQGN